MLSFTLGSIVLFIGLSMGTAYILAVIVDWWADLSVDKIETLNDAERFLEWVRQKPESEAFDYADSKNCPFAQYLKDNGVVDPLVAPFHFVPSPAVGADKQVRISKPIAFALACCETETYGALRERLEKEISIENNFVST